MKKLELQSLILQADTRSANLVSAIYRLENESDLKNTDAARALQDALDKCAQSMTVLFRKVIRDC